VVLRGAGDVAGQRLGPAEYKNPQDLPQDCPVSLVDRGGCSTGWAESLEAVVEGTDAPRRGASCAG